MEIFRLLNVRTATNPNSVAWEGIELGKVQDAFGGVLSDFRFDRRDFLPKRVLTPEILSIGPLHHGDCESMENHKLRCLADLEERRGSIEQERFQKALADAIKELEEKTLNCYGRSQFNLSREEFVLLDGYLVVHLLVQHGESRVVLDPIFQGRLPLICRDLLLLENQLPWFLLDRIYKLTRVDDDEAKLQTLAIDLFASALQIPLPFHAIYRDPIHLLDLFRMAFRHYLSYDTPIPSIFFERRFLHVLTNIIGYEEAYADFHLVFIT